MVFRGVLTRNKFIATIQSFKNEIRRAFAVEGSAQPLSAEELVLLTRVAEAVVARRMATPALLFLDSLGPMSFLGSQALHFFTPILDVVFPQRDVERVARLLERRETLSRLAELIARRTDRCTDPA